MLLLTIKKKQNKKCVYFFLGKWKPNDYPFVDNIRAIYLTLEKLIQPEETQVNGIVILVDYTGVGLSQASNPGPLLAKKVVGILQVRHCNCSPVIHYDEVIDF